MLDSVQSVSEFTTEERESLEALNRDAAISPEKSGFRKLAG